MPIPCKLLPVALLAALPAMANEMRIDEGRGLYLDICAECHAEDARGDIGADIRGAPAAEIAENLENQDSMQGLRLDPGEITAIATYLATLTD